MYGSKVIRRPALFEADASGHLPGTDGYDVKDGSFLSNLVNKPKLVMCTVTKLFHFLCDELADQSLVQ